MPNKVGLSTPWVTYARKVNALFEKDPEILVDYENEGPTLTIYVENAAKADALEQLLPASKEFGNVTLNIKVVPANSQTKISLFRNAFAGNPIVNKVETTVEMAPGAPQVNYVIFAREVVSFFNDDLGDYFGAESTLYEDLARDVFDLGEDGIFFCTDLEKTTDGLSFGTPLGEWP